MLTLCLNYRIQYLSTTKYVHLCKILACIHLFMNIFPTAARITTLGYMEFHCLPLGIIRKREKWGLGTEMGQKADGKAEVKFSYNEVF